MDDLAPRQRAVLDFFISHLDQVGTPPTYREIAEALGIRSTNGVADHIKALERKGYLERSGDGRSRARSLRLTEKALGRQRDEGTVAVPILGRVAAGHPILADEAYDGTLRFDAQLLPPGSPVFALRVSGDSMIDEGILDGDLVLVRRQQAARNGELVVVLVDGEATVKRWYREPGRIRLQPSNRDMEPIYLDPTQEVALVGRVVALLRGYERPLA